MVFEAIWIERKVSSSSSRLRGTGLVTAGSEGLVRESNKPWFASEFDEV